MKNSILFYFVACLLTALAYSQSPAEVYVNTPTREVVMSKLVAQIEQQNEEIWLSNISNPNASNDLRIASAVLILKKSESVDSHMAALKMLPSRMEASINEWESANDWRLEYPVAAAALKHPELMPLIIEFALSGHVPENAAVFMLIYYHKRGLNPEALLEEGFEKAATEEQRKRGEKYLSIFKKKL